MEPNYFQIHEIFVMDNYRVTEYTTRYGTRRFDIQPWKKEMEVRIPVEGENGSWEVKSYPVQIPKRAPVIGESVSGMD